MMENGTHMRHSTCASVQTVCFRTTVASVPVLDP
jgi:hypothetical protein